MEHIGAYLFVLVELSQWVLRPAANPFKKGWVCNLLVFALFVLLGSMP